MILVHYDQAAPTEAGRVPVAAPLCGTSAHPRDTATSWIAWVTCPHCTPLMPTVACTCWYGPTTGHAGHCCFRDLPDDHPEGTRPPCGCLPSLDVLDLLAEGDTDEARQAAQITELVRGWRAERNQQTYQQDDLLSALDELTQGKSPERSTP